MWNNSWQEHFTEDETSVDFCVHCILLRNLPPVATALEHMTQVKTLKTSDFFAIEMLSQVKKILHPLNISKHCLYMLNTANHQLQTDLSFSFYLPFCPFIHELTFPPAFVQLLMDSSSLQAEVLLHCNDGRFYEAEQLVPYLFFLFCFFFSVQHQNYVNELSRNTSNIHKLPVRR